MAMSIRNTNEEIATEDAHENLSTEVQSYLINNYREALDRGDKGVAKSCLLAARYFSNSHQDVTNEIYLMAKADHDINEASKCFTKIFTHLMRHRHNETASNNSLPNEKSNTDQVISQMRNEINSLLADLKIKHLKLKCRSTNLGLDPIADGQHHNTPNMYSLNSLVPNCHSRVRMISIDSNREGSSKNEAQNKGSFYLQLYEHLPEEIKRDIMHYSIETCDNLIEKCQLIILIVTLYNDCIEKYANLLLKTLTDLSDSSKNIVDGSSSLNHTYHAKSLLVLDAIPLILSLKHSQRIDVIAISYEELFERTLNYYLEHNLEIIGREYLPSDLNEGMRKSIAARIIGIDNVVGNTEQLNEDHLLGTLKFLSHKIIDSIDDLTVKTKLEELRSIVNDRTRGSSPKFNRILEIIQCLGLEIDIPDEILFSSYLDGKFNDSPSVGSQQSVIVSTPPPPAPKTRGRPKKVVQQQVAQSSVNLDDSVRRHLQCKTRESNLVFYSIIEYMFVNCARYLRNTRSRILINFDLKPLISLIDSELIKGPATKGGRAAKSNAQQAIQAPNSPTKRIKLEDGVSKMLNISPNTRESPLNSEKSKQMDQQVLSNLEQAYECYKFFHSNNGVFSKLWLKFTKSNSLISSTWFNRIRADALLMSANYEGAVELLDIDGDEMDSMTSETVKDGSIATTISSSSSISVAQVRRLAQLTSCNIQLVNKFNTLSTINHLLIKLKDCGLLNCDCEPYENVLDDYIIHIKHEKVDHLGFLLFDSLSLIRFVFNIVIEIHRRYTINANTINDLIVGHSIVLSQFDWPKESQLYKHCINWILSNKPKSATPQTLSAATKFTYQEFFQHVKNPNIIEDFMALLNQGYTLEIKGPASAAAAHSSHTSVSVLRGQSGGSQTGGSSAATSTRSSKMITTRGVNKSFRDELKVALIAQMRHSSILAPLGLISGFIQDSMIPFLASFRT